MTAAGALDEREKAEYMSFGPVVECDPDAPHEVVPTLRSHCASGVTTFSEGMVPLTSRLAQGIHLPFHDRDTVNLLTDKLAQRRRLAERRVDAVWSELVTSRTAALALVEERGHPVVVKPVRSQSSRDTYYVENAAQFPDGLEPSGERPFVVEEYLSGRDEGEYGDYVSVETLVVDGRAFTLGITGKFPLSSPFREHGQFLPARLPGNESSEVAHLAADAAQALGIQMGLVHTEIKLTARGPRIIEVNGRLGGFLGELYQRASGQNLLALGIAVACGQPVDPPPPAAPETVEFQYSNLPPVTGGVLRRVGGADIARKEPGIVDYTVRLPEGEKLPTDVMTLFIDLLRGSAPDHASMLKTIDRALAHLCFSYERPDGTTYTWQSARGDQCTAG
ncbi:ATP-grasp domain-containing protein [Streptomyces decoyicus]|uniref:ATP-grasp domain-containing protein n=1 Tax=Streptomyces decoyicus TaxID=249567 RepID=A0ABZ1FCU8_9ACTN|nr:ATP-grasp domain-containing protein [Streptomyces decoyicus]WSB68190.1 ATP-grasp domain-containing protein [Streptomyces decoyicus]